MGWDYDAFRKTKRVEIQPSGFDIDPAHLNSHLFHYQRDIVRWNLRRGKSSNWVYTGGGKTIMQLAFADALHNIKGCNVLLLTPLAVAQQTKREAERFRIVAPVQICKCQAEVKPGITITNYEKLHHFDTSLFDVVIGDELSCIKDKTSKTRNMMIERFIHTPYKLGCTATPSPNDEMELGNHIEWMGVMTMAEMLAMYFQHDGGETQKWKLMGWAEDEFWKWLATFAVLLTQPSDLGYPNDGFELPPLHYHEHVVEHKKKPKGLLFDMPARTLNERRGARKDSLNERVKLAAEIANSTSESFICWCDLNAESAALTKAIKGAVEIKGADSDEHKERTMLGFADGSIRKIVTKSSICGWGMNFQICHQMAFVGLSDSWEALKQSIARCHRYGQTNPVHAHLIIGDREGEVLRNLRRKEKQEQRLIEGMVRNMASVNRAEVRGMVREETDYNTKAIGELPAWLLNV